MHWVLGLFFPPGPRPLDYCLDLLRQPGQVRGIDRLDVGVRRGLLHAYGGPTVLDETNVIHLRWYPKTRQLAKRESSS